jgi:hypothetical protein
MIKVHVFCIIHIGGISVRLNDTSYSSTTIISFPSTNCQRKTTMTNDYVLFILIRVLNDEQIVLEHRVLHQPYLHRLHGLKYNTLPYNDIVMVNDMHIVIQLKTINYSPM